jgi:hypothetical protein
MLHIMANTGKVGLLFGVKTCMVIKIIQQVVKEGYFYRCYGLVLVGMNAYFTGFFAVGK